LVNLGRLQKAIDDKKIDAGKPIDAAAMQAAGLFKDSWDGVRLLGKGEIKTKIEVKVAGASASAIAAVEKAGGKVELPPKPAAPAA
jgi:large subunit ribosomal protein L15